MNIMDELDRITAPLPTAGRVHALSREEILRLQLEGKITPISRIPQYHHRPKVISAARRAR